jgi:chemotaxis protein histidine kinase CheA
MIMTQDKARKTAARRRMAETGEPYCEARRAAGAEADPGGDGLGGATPPGPREEDWYARMAEEAGLSVAEIRVQEIAAQARQQAAEARERAEQAEELAERARERAEQADEAAMLAHEAADLAAEAAAITRGWADPDEQDQAQRRADQAADAAKEAQRRAEAAEEAADRAEEVAGEAEEAADEAEEFAGEAQERAGEFGGEAGEFGGGPHERVRRAHRTGGRRDHWGWDHPEPPEPPEPPGPPEPPRHPGHPGAGPDPGDWLADQVGLVLRRFGRLQERAEQMVSRAERMFGPSHQESSHPDRPRSPGSG